MIKMFALGTRRADLTPVAFHDYYRHPHGTLGLTVPTVLRYVQSHQIHSDLLPVDQGRFDAVAELWVEGPDEVAGFREEPNLVRNVRPDEPKFADTDRLQFLVMEEEVLDSSTACRSEADRLWTPDNRPVSIKLIQLIGGGRQDWAHSDDGTLGCEISALRHVRCRPVPAFAAAAAEFHGVRELWWPTLSAFRAGAAAAPQAFDRLVRRADASVTLLVQAERFL